jgi:hypothetical protein
LVERAREPGEGRDTYRLLDDVWLESFGRADDRFARMAATLTAGMNAVGPGSPASRRLADAWSFFLFLRGEFPRLTALWKEQRLREWLCVIAIRWPIAHSR